MEEVLEKNFPETLLLNYEPSELDRLESIVKRYIDAGPFQEQVWEHYKLLFHK